MLTTAAADSVYVLPQRFSHLADLLVAVRSLDLDLLTPMLDDLSTDDRETACQSRSPF